jgi:GTPase SAR1 family protein
MHTRQRIDALTPPGGPAAVAVDEAGMLALFDAALDAYQATFPDAQVVTFDVDRVRFAFDGAAGDDREPRTVAALARSIAPPAGRDTSRQRGFPLSAALRAAGYEKGHLIAHASGGGLDANVFPQARHINQGRSPQGRRYRRLETLVARSPGSLMVHRLIYGDGSSIPDLNELTVLVDGCLYTGMFDNRPSSWQPDTAALRRGQRFHQQVQYDFLAGLLGADARPEHSLTLAHGRGGRIDLLVLPQGGQRVAVIVEIKSTDWDTRPPHRVRRLIRAHIRQLQNYLDVYVDQIVTPPTVGHQAGVTGGWDSVAGVLIYPRRPTQKCRRQWIDELTQREALMVVWLNETDWSSSTH